MPRPPASLPGVVVFPALAWGGLDPAIVGGMFVAKVAGGSVWAGFLSMFVRREAA